MTTGRIDATYILPIKAANASHASELCAYLNELPVEQIVVVDGSPAGVFAAHGAALDPRIRHVPPDPHIGGRNGKVRGVLTGLRYAERERVLVADDDVRYDRKGLHDVLAALDAAAVVRPQNYFTPLPWHAILDTARILINRALDGDWPGTLAFRRSYLPRGYNPDVLFENLELVRTVRANGGFEAVRRDLYVRRRPPVTSHFWSQRVRQAYDEFARPARLAVALAIFPLLALGVAQHTAAYAVAIVAATYALALRGWLRDGGYRYFPFAAVLVAPAWVLERGACAWLALYERLRYGGVRYAGGIVAAAASSKSEIHQEWAV
jgi:hypothetical protein